MYVSYPWRIFLKDQLCSEMLYINKIKFLIWSAVCEKKKQERFSAILGYILDGLNEI